MSYRILITGSRSFKDVKLIESAVLDASTGHEAVVIIHGAAEGADQRADQVAFRHKFIREIYPADWRRYGRYAGPKRNDIMVEEGADVCLVFRVPRVPSPGTDDCACKAEAAGIELREYWSKEETEL